MMMCRPHFELVGEGIVRRGQNSSRYKGRGPVHIYLSFDAQPLYPESVVLSPDCAIHVH